MDLEFYNSINPSISSYSKIEVDSRYAIEPLFVTLLDTKYPSPRNVAPIARDPHSSDVSPQRMEDASDPINETWTD